MCNDGDDAVVRLQEGPTEFIAQLHQHCPPLARIDSVKSESLARAQQPVDFSIRQSTGGMVSTQIIPDTATRPECLVEVNTPSERRYQYPFINCTRCGPHFAIIRAMPYDRSFIIVVSFPFCAQCDKEYRDPYDRQSRAQPVAYPACGPHLEWFHTGERVEKKVTL